MNVNGIGTAGYQAWQGTRKAQQNAVKRSFAEQVNNVADTPKVYNIFTDEDMLWTGGNGTGLSYYLKYAEDSTEDDPTIIAKGVDENGNEFEKTIHINEINPKSATVVEMRALEAHMGVKKLGGFTSLPMEAGAMGLNDRTDFMEMFQKQIGDMMVLVYKCGQKKLNNLYYQVKEQRRRSTWRKTKNLTLRNLNNRLWICIMPEEPRIHNWNVNMA